MTDVLFIHPGNQSKVYQQLAGEFTAVAPPIWTCLVAEHVRSRGLDAAIYDANSQGWDAQTPSTLAARYNPRLVVILVYGHHPSASTQTMPAASAIARDIRAFNADIPIAMGGTHPSALPQRTLTEESIDYVIQGEGVHTVGELVRYLKGSVPLAHVPGLWYQGAKGIETTGPAPLLTELDSQLPGYAWDLLPPLSTYRAHNWHCFQEFEKSAAPDFADVRSPYVALYSSLGCPYNCEYCCINAIFGKPSIRYWSLDSVLGWIDTLVTRHGVKNIMFADELFILSPQRIERFCDSVIERGYDLNFWVYARVDTVREHLLAKMKKAGINWICLGIESGNDLVRDGVNKNIRGNISQTVKLLQSYDLYVMGNYMFGLPDDSHETMQQTLSLAKELNCEFANFYSVMAYPGSRLYEQMSTVPGALPEAWGAYSQHSYETKPLPTTTLTSGEVLAFRDKAFLEYFSNPQYLNLAQERFGYSVRAHIEKMLSIPLKRKLCETA